MIKNLAGLEVKIAEEVIKLVCGSQCPLTHIKEALLQFAKHIGNIEDQATKAQEAEKAKEVEQQENSTEKPCSEEEKDEPCQLQE